MLWAAYLVAGAVSAQTTITVPTDEPNIQAGIAAAAAGDTVLVLPGTYVENLVLKSDVIVQGEEAARTFLDPGNANPAVLVDGGSNVRFSNFTIINATVGVSVLNTSSAITIANNVFDTTTDFGVVIEVTSAAEILNNVFFNNGTGVSRGVNTAARIANNVFLGNALSIQFTTLVTNIDHNCYFDNDAGDGIGSPQVTGDPLFVSTGLRDFHLRENSACIDVGTGTDVIDGTTADAGTYGGDFADKRPYPVPEPSLSDSSTATVNIDVDWDTNPAYLVTNSGTPGSYRVYYVQNNPPPPWDGMDASNGISPVSVVAANSSSQTLTLIDLQPVAPAPGQPILTAAAPLFESVELSWNAVAGANGYRVHYGEMSTNENQVDAGNTTTFTVTGLQNGVTYKFAVSALAQATYFIAVTAVDSTADKNESVFSDTATIGIGPQQEGTLSAELMATPSVTIAFPDLPDKGCFVATTAFGAAWAPEVAVLRDFRDRVLLRSMVGRAFVRGYYTHGPAAAEFIDARAYLKPLVRALLTPLVLFALVVMHASPPAIAALSALLALLAARRWVLR